MAICLAKGDTMEIKNFNNKVSSHYIQNNLRQKLIKCGNFCNNVLYKYNVKEYSIDSWTNTITSLHDNDNNACINSNYMKHKLQKIYSIKIRINQSKYNQKIGFGLTSYKKCDYIYYGGKNINFK